MSLLSLPTGAAVDNAPDAPVCPRWLLLLDDPEPARVLFVGATDPATVAWFTQAGAEVEHDDERPVSGPVDLLDLVIIGAEVGRTSRRRGGRAALVATLAARCGPRAALTAAWSAGDTPNDALTEHGFAIIRPLGPALAGGSRRGEPGFVAVRSGDPLRPSDDPPLWLTSLTEHQPWAAGPGGWTLRVPGAYPSQKSVVMLRPRAGGPAAGVLKLTRHPRFNERLDNEYLQLRHLADAGPDAARRAPAALASGRVAGMSAVVEEAIDGVPFLDATSLRTDCPHVQDAVAAITDLGAATVRAVPGSSFAEPLSELHERFVARHDPSVAEADYLAEQIAVLASHDVPAVLFHGDLGTWNLMVVDDAVRILDWESAEDPGPPLWDLAYFVRSLAVRSGRRRALDRDRAIDRYLVATSPFNEAATAWFGAYADRIGLADELLAPLFHLGWMHRAVKEANRLAPDQPGHYGPLCRRLARAHDAPGVRRLTRA